MLTILSRTVGFAVIVAFACVGVMTVFNNLWAWKSCYDHQHGLTD